MKVSVFIIMSQFVQIPRTKDYATINMENKKTKKKQVLLSNAEKCKLWDLYDNDIKGDSQVEQPIIVYDKPNENHEHSNFAFRFCWYRFFRKTIRYGS